MKKKMRSESPSVRAIPTDEMRKIGDSPYFKKKDEQAIEFLKKHPIPPEILERHSK